MGGSVRQRITRVLAAGTLLVMYAFGMVATTGAFVAAGVSPAHRAARPGSRLGWSRPGPGRGNGVGAAVGIGVGAAIIGGAIAASAAEQQRRDAVSYCMQRYRSFDPQSMTYLGQRRLSVAPVRRWRLLAAMMVQDPGRGAGVFVCGRRAA